MRNISKIDKPSISVIIPVYNVATFVEKCVASLMLQTLKIGIEYIFVNDASNDGSMDIIKKTISKFPERISQILIIEHSQNKGLPAARNSGLSVASGNYIFHCDSDDFVEPDMLELLLNKAQENDADMVWCDWFLSFNSKERYMKQPFANSPREALANMLNGSMKYNVWNKIVKRSIYYDNQIYFPEGYSMGEDITMIKVVSKCKYVGYLNKALYHYVKVNGSAMSALYDNNKLNHLKHNVDDIVIFLNKNINDLNIIKEISWFLLNIKLPFLFTGRKNDIKLWQNLYSESNPYIWSNHSQSLRTRILQLAASHGLGWINMAYYYIIQKFIYGKIYK